MSREMTMRFPVIKSEQKSSKREDSEKERERKITVVE